MTAAAQHIGAFEPGTPEWVNARSGGLGGSEIAAVLGLSPWESRFSLWHRKKGLVSPVVDNAILEWGRRLEDCIALKYADDHPDVQVETTGMWRNTKRPWQIASPDRFVTDSAGTEPLELKTAHDDLGWGEPGTDEVPVYYRAQTLWYLDTLEEYPRCRLAVLIGGSDYREYVIEANPGEAEFMRRRAQEFIDTMRRDERPDIDAHSATYQAIREMHPDIEPADYPAPPEIAEPYLDAVEAAKAADREKRRATAVLADAMHTCRTAKYLGDVIATRVPGRNGGPPFVRAQPVKTPGRRTDAA